LEAYQAKLNALLESIQIELHPLDHCKRALDFVEMSIQFLEDSTLNTIPFETVFCLNKCLDDWGEKEMNYIIVTALRDDYSFNKTLSLDEIEYTLMKDNFGVEFQSRLIQISIPKYEVQDYFYNIILYHELGHFVDLYYSISNSIYAQHYIDIENDSGYSEEHIREYFADIFCSQYIGYNSLYYLNYGAYGHGESETHPSNIEREEILKCFIDPSDDDSLEVKQLVENLKEDTRLTTGLELKIRFKEVPSDDFLNFLPPVLNSDEELHGLFSSIWKIWMFNRKDFKHSSDEEVYGYLNNLIEKSISNYMVQEKWNSNVSE
jgi:hypothetical protein